MKKGDRAESKGDQVLGDRIKGILKERGISQANLAELTKIKPSHLSRLLSGKRAWTRPYLEAVSIALDTKVEELVRGMKAVQLIQPNGAYVERDYLERVAGELAATTSRLQEADAENKALLDSKAELEARVAHLTATLDHGERKRREAVQLAEQKSAQVDELSAQLVELRNVVARHEVRIKELRALCAMQKSQLEEANRQIIVNFDAYQQADARARALEVEAGKKGDAAVAASLFSGLLGLGLGVAASSSSPSSRTRARSVRRM